MEPIHICGEHAFPLMHRGDTCPWCDFIREMRLSLEAEYKRGFADGIAAVEKEQASTKVAKETEP